MSLKNKLLKICCQFLEGVKYDTFYELNQELLKVSRELNEIETNYILYIFNKLISGYQEQNYNRNNYLDIAIEKNGLIFISSKYELPPEKNEYRIETEANLLKREGNSFSLSFKLLMRILEKKGVVKGIKLNESENPQEILDKMKEVLNLFGEKRNKKEIKYLNDFSDLVENWSYYLKVYPNLIKDQKKCWFNVKYTKNTKNKSIITLSSLCLLRTTDKLEILKNQEDILIQRSVINLIRKKFYEKLDKKEDILFNPEDSKPIIKVDLIEIKKGLENLLNLVNEYEIKNKILDDSFTPLIIENFNQNNREKINYNCMYWSLKNDYQIITEDIVFQEVGVLKERVTNTFEIYKRDTLKSFYEIIEEFKDYNYPNIYIGDRDYIVNLISESHFQINFENMEEYRNYFEEYHRKIIISIRPVDYLSLGGNIELSFKLNRFNRNLIFLKETILKG